VLAVARVASFGSCFIVACGKLMSPRLEYVVVYHGWSILVCPDAASYEA